MASLWHGGMALTGVVAGMIVAVLVFSLVYRTKFLVIADEIVIPLCLLLLLVRIGNHLNGELYGSVTGGWPGVKFPYSDGFRHPVALYEALKDLIIFFILLAIAGGQTIPGRGKTTGHFIFWSGLGSLIIDYFSISSRHFTLNAGTQQFFYVLLIILGLLLIAYAARHAKKSYNDLSSMQFAPISFRNRRSIIKGGIVLKIVLFAVILIFCLTLPGARTQQSIKDPASRPCDQAV